MPGSGGTHSQAAEAAERGVRAAASLSTAVAGAENVSAGTSTPRSPTPSVPITKLLGRQGLTRALLLLALATAKASPLHSATPTSTTAAATPTASAAATSTSTPTAAASTASITTTATEAPTPATTPTSTPTPSTASTTTAAAPAIPSSTLAPLAPAAAAPPTKSRHSSDRLRANKVDISSRGNRGQKRDGGAPLKERDTRVTTRGSYSYYTRLCCKEALLEEVNGEHELGRKRSAVAGVTSAESPSFSSLLPSSQLPCAPALPNAGPVMATSPASLPVVNEPMVRRGLILTAGGNDVEVFEDQLNALSEAPKAELDETMMNAGVVLFSRELLSVEQLAKLSIVTSTRAHEEMAHPTPVAFANNHHDGLLGKQVILVLLRTTWMKKQLCAEYATTQRVVTEHDQEVLSIIDLRLDMITSFDHL
ncbi:unnamed protein product, partial [Closterium sp. NIES-54]